MGERRELRGLEDPAPPDDARSDRSTQARVRDLPAAGSR